MRGASRFRGSKVVNRHGAKPGADRRSPQDPRLRRPLCPHLMALARSTPQGNQRRHSSPSAWMSAACEPERSFVALLRRRKRTALEVRVSVSHIIAVIRVAQVGSLDAHRAASRGDVGPPSHAERSRRRHRCDRTSRGLAEPAWTWSRSGRRTRPATAQCEPRSSAVGDRHPRQEHRGGIHQRLHLGRASSLPESVGRHRGRVVVTRAPPIPGQILELTSSGRWLWSEVHRQPTRGSENRCPVRHHMNAT